jgi:hypothetical protein
MKNPPFLAVLFLTGCTGLIFSGTIQAQEQQSWDLRGRLDASWRYRSQNRTGQIDQTALLYGYLDAEYTGRKQDTFRFHFQGYANADLNGLEGSDRPFYGLSDTRDHSIRAFLYGAYAEVPIAGPDVQFRLGRQEINSEDALYFDGGRVEYQSGGPVSGFVYAGLPVRFYESTRSGDLLMGGGLNWRIERNFRVSFEQIFLRDQSPPGDPSITVRNDLSILTANWVRDEHMSMRGSSSWLDGHSRRINVAVYLNYPERGWWTQFRLQRQNDYGEVVATDLSPIAVTLGDVAPYWRGGGEFHRMFTSDLDFGLGFQGRWLADQADLGEFNREYSRWFATLTGQNMVFSDVEAGLRADLWHSTDAEILAGGAYAAYEPERGERYEIGTDFSEYRYDVFTGREYLDDRQIYGRVRYPMTKDSSLRFRIARDRSQFGTDLLLQIAVSLEF